MTRLSRLYARVRLGKGPSFKELQTLVRAFGFQLERISGSHHIYRHPQTASKLNLQPSGKEAKGYQVRQFLDMVDNMGLRLDEE